VVKEESYFAPKQGLRQERGRGPCRGADVRQRRDPQGSGGVVPKLRVAAQTGLESNLFSHAPRRAANELPVNRERNGKGARTGRARLQPAVKAHIQRGFAESEEIILCAFLRPARLVPFKVSMCTDYHDKRMPSKSDMEEIAWIIRTKDVNRPVGFTKKEMDDDTKKEDEPELVPSE
jgi:hypothetical protein